MVHCSVQSSVGHHAGGPTSPSFMRMQSSHQPIKPYSYIVIRCVWGRNVLEYPQSFTCDPTHDHSRLVCITWWRYKLTHPSTATSYSQTGGLGGQRYLNQLDILPAAACYCKKLATAKKTCYNPVAMLLLGGAELRMRISLAPHPGQLHNLERVTSCKAWSRSQTTWIRSEHQTMAQPSFLNNAHFRVHAGLHLSDLFLGVCFRIVFTVRSDAESCTLAP